MDSIVPKTKRSRSRSGGRGNAPSNVSPPVAVEGVGVAGEQPLDTSPPRSNRTAKSTARRVETAGTTANITPDCAGKAPPCSNRNSSPADVALRTVTSLTAVGLDASRTTTSLTAIALTAMVTTAIARLTSDQTDRDQADQHGSDRSESLQHLCS